MQFFGTNRRRWLVSGLAAPTSGYRVIRELERNEQIGHFDNMPKNVPVVPGGSVLAPVGKPGESVIRLLAARHVGNHIFEYPGEVRFSIALAEFVRVIKISVVFRRYFLT